MTIPSQRYKWDDETQDDTPSEFATTTFATSAFHSTWSQDQRRHRRSARRAGVWIVLTAVGTSALVLYGIAHWLRH